MNQNDQHPEPTAPTLQPGVVASYKHGWRQLRKYWKKLLLILAISYVATLPVSLLSGHRPSLGWIFGFAYNILIIIPLWYGLNFAFLRAVRGHPLKVKDMFTSFENYLNAVLAGLLVSVITIIGLVLLIIPGIIFCCKFAFIPYLVVDRKMEVIEAIKTSWRMTTGHVWKVFLIGLIGLLVIPIFLAWQICLRMGIPLLMILLLKVGVGPFAIVPIFLAVLICYVVGMILSFMWLGLAYASLYHSVA